MTRQHDRLTGLDRLMLETIRPGSTLACIDLVHFRDRVNSPLGHRVGDRVLTEVAQRLVMALAPWPVFRSGGDEFAVEVPAALDREGAAELADRVALALASPMAGTGGGLEATVGVCLRTTCDDAGPMWAAALRSADTEAPRRGLRLWVADDTA